MCILLLYVILCDMGRYFSVDAIRRNLRTQPWPLAMLHNVGLVLCVFQVFLVYLFSTFYKVTGTEWQNGTALYYALSDVQFNTGPLANLLLQHPLWLTI